MNTGEFFVIGASHWTAPLEVREKLAIDDAGAAALRTELAAVSELREYAMLSTCNRIEFYGVGAGSAAERVQAAFCARRGVDPADFARYRLSIRGRDALLHLLEVASGLDSQMLGETEILGQVKEAYASAHAAGSTGPVLNRAFQKAFQAAKHVRTHTAIGFGQVSVSSVAVDLAANIFGSLSAARVLVLGSGEIGGKTARAFRSRGAAELAVAGRSPGRVSEVAAELSAAAIPFHEFAGRLSEFDVVVCSTSAPHPVVGKAAVAAAMRQRPARPLFFIDLALPRDVEPSAADLQNVFLYNLDDLARIAEENRAARAAEISRCRELLAHRADALWRHITAQLAPLSPDATRTFAQGPRPVLPP